MKTSDIILSANKNLMKNKLRSFLTILAIFVGSFTIIMNSAISAGVNSYIDSQINSMGGEGYLEMMPAEMYDTAMALMGNSGVKEYTEDAQNANKAAYIKPEQIEKAKKIKGIKSFDALGNASIDYVTSDQTDKRWVMRLNASVDGISLDLAAGRQPNADTNDIYEIAISKDMVEPLGFKDEEDAVNKTIYIGVPSEAKCFVVEQRKDCQTIIKATISGVQADGILSMGGSRVNLALWKKIGSINNIGVPEASIQPYMATANVDPERIEEIKDELKEIGLIAMSVKDEVGSIKTFFDAILAILNVFGGIALIAASIGIVNTLLMSVQERTREIGLMKALGMSRAKIFLSFTFEAVALGFWGSMFGMIVSMVLGYAGNALVHAEGMFLESLPTFQLVKFSPDVVTPIIILVMFISFVAGTAPALKAARKNPIDALRYEQEA